MTITRVEAAFRSLKTDLGLRPVFHQTADRTRARLFIAALAYHLLADIEARMQKAGDLCRWSSLRDLLFTHVRQDVSGRVPIRRPPIPSGFPRPPNRTRRLSTKSWGSRTPPEGSRQDPGTRRNPSPRLRIKKPKLEYLNAVFKNMKSTATTT